MYFWKNSTQHALIRYYTHTGGRGAKRRGAKFFRQILAITRLFAITLIDVNCKFPFNTIISFTRLLDT